MEFSSITDIVDYAIEKEIEAAQFYEEAAGNIELVGASQVLKEYAAEERKHEQILKDFKGNKAKVTEYKFEKIQDIKRSDFLVEMTYRPDMNYEDLIRLAMKREEKANQLYLVLAKSADDANHAQFFEMLAQEELKHKNALEKLYDDHMAQMGD
jgi:rubrerythrin